MIDDYVNKTYHNTSDMVDIGFGTMTPCQVIL